MEILNYSESPVGAYHIAEFSVYIPNMDWYIHRMQLKKSKKGSLYLGYPVYCTGEENEYGKKIFKSVSHPGEKRKAEFEKAVLDLVKPMLKPSDPNFSERF